MTRLFLVLACLGVASAAHAQTLLAQPLARGSYDTDGQAFGATGGGSDLVWVADHDAGFLALDLSDPDLPVPRVARDTPSFARNIAVDDTLVFVADRFSGLRVYKWNPVTAGMGLRGTVDTPGLALSVEAWGEYALVADKESGLQVVSVADPTAPTIVGSADTPGFASDVAVAGLLAFVADLDQGIRIFDLDDPTAPAPRGHYATTTDANAIVVRDGLAYVAAGTGGLLVLDVTDPDLPGSYGSLGTAGTANELALVGDYVLLAAGSAGLRVIDVTNPAAPVEVRSWPTSDTAFHVAAVGPFAALACGAAGVEIVQVFEPEATGTPAARAGALRLLPNRPNPFNARTVLQWIAAPTGGPVEIEVFDLAGRRVVDLRPAAATGLRQSLVWDGRDATGRAVASGVYPYVLRQGDVVRQGRMTLLK